MITPEAMREMADSLDDEAMHKMQRTFGSGCDSPSCAISGNLASDAAAMLRSIAAEREAEPLPRDTSRFRYWAEEKPAQIPEGFKAPLEIKTSLQMCREAEEETNPKGAE